MRAVLADMRGCREECKKIGLNTSFLTMDRLIGLCEQGHINAERLKSYAREAGRRVVDELDRKRKQKNTRSFGNDLAHLERGRATSFSWNRLYDEYFKAAMQGPVIIVVSL
jgi:hypothetical protein